MKKRCEWNTKAKQRGSLADDRGIVDLLHIRQHFFAGLTDGIAAMNDPRNESYITYTQNDLICMGLMKNLCGRKTMRSMDEQFNNENCINTLREMSGNRHLREMPHRDTLNRYLSMLPAGELAGVRDGMLSKLLRRKSLAGARLFGRYWRIILDGTGLYCFRERHCEHCLTRKHAKADGTAETRYFHKVLEAKIVLGKNIIVSLDTEFIENETAGVSKQDCETAAAERLLKRLYQNHPKLPVCIQGDSLYASEKVMEFCRLRGWQYLFTHKEGRQPSLSECYEFIRGGDERNVVKRIGREKGTGEYVNGVGETAGKKETANIFEYRYEERKKDGKRTEHRLMWVTNMEITDRNLAELIEAGRGRWKIENEGFNNQKNGIYDIEHANSRDGNAMKNHYLLTQIADMIMQFYLACNRQRKKGILSIKNTSSRLLESFRSHHITDEDVLYIRRSTTVHLE